MIQRYLLHPDAVYCALRGTKTNILRVFLEGAFGAVALIGLPFPGRSFFSLLFGI
jgi:hypothetical protein